MNFEARSNVPELSVSELAHALKRTLEDTYGRVRVRGELSKVKVHSSGHLYSDLKDADAVLNIICWKGTLAKLSIKPAEGLEVICTGRISSYPARSNYQMIVETMELAGAGALLKMLEDRRKMFEAEGLFEPARKKTLPFLPEVIGVVTSPTGAVIRDIMHRLDDRFPRSVLLWPVSVQGPGAATQIAAAIDGFNTLPKGGKVPRPDLIIVARGGGSLEDLMPFNEEVVVRAASRSEIPLISAVGHETDTTLIDFVSDHRAPTPTAAAEVAVPRRLDLFDQLAERQHRLSQSLTRRLREGRQSLETLTARLGHPQSLLDLRVQRVDSVHLHLEKLFERGLAQKVSALNDAARRLIDPRMALALKAQALARTSHALDTAYVKGLKVRDSSYNRLQGGLRDPRTLIAEKQRLLGLWADRLRPDGLLKTPGETLAFYARMLETLSFKSVLQRGFVVVQDASGAILTKAAQTSPGQDVHLRFADDTLVPARVKDSD